MPIWGDWKEASIALGGTATDEIDLGREWEYLQVRIPTIDAADLSVQTSDVIGGTYQALGKDIKAAAGTGAYNDVWRLGLWRCVKIVSSVAQSAARTFYVRGWRD